MMRGGVRRAAIFAALFSLNAGAQDGFDSSRASAGVLASGVFTDNFYYNTTDEPQESAYGAIVAPSATYRATKGRLDLLANASGEFATYDLESSADDYEDAKAGISSSWLATRRGRLDLRTSFERSHDPFGINRTEDATVRDRDLDIWHATQAGMLFHYGAPEATLNAEVGLSALEKQYQTNEADTHFLDYSSSTLQYTIFYNFSPKTATLFDFVRTNVVFPNPFGPLDERSGDEYRVRTGLRWLATAKTSGDIRVGTFRRSFEGSASTEQGLDWEAGVQWAPRARSLFELNAGRGTQESYRADTRVNITRTVSVGWKQYWGSRMTSTVAARRTQTDFIGLDRTDTIYNVRVGVDYSLSRLLTAALAVDSSQRDSNDPTSEFDRSSAFLGVRLDY
jgi:polysaccharide biosynthesis protein VpsM